MTPQPHRTTCSRCIRSCRVQPLRGSVPLCEICRRIVRKIHRRRRRRSRAGDAPLRAPVPQRAARHSDRWQASTWWLRRVPIAALGLRLHTRNALVLKLRSRLHANPKSKRRAALWRSGAASSLTLRAGISGRFVVSHDAIPRTAQLQNALARAIDRSCSVGAVAACGTSLAPSRWDRFHVSSMSSNSPVKLPGEILAQHQYAIQEAKQLQQPPLHREADPRGSVENVTKRGQNPS